MPSNFLRIICNVITVPDEQIFSFCLIRKRNPKLSQISTMGCIIENTIAEKRITKE